MPFTAILGHLCGGGEHELSRSCFQSDLSPPILKGGFHEKLKKNIFVLSNTFKGIDFGKNSQKIQQCS